MAQLGIKNISKKAYSGTYDGVIYEFKAGELRLLESEVAVHIVGASNLSAIGGYALKIVPLDQIPEELRREPETKTDSLAGLRNVSKETVEIMFDGKIFKFPKGGVVFLHRDVAAEMISRSMSNGKAALVEEKPAPKKEVVGDENPKAAAKLDEKKDKKEGK